jgi:GTP cyclohydrolase I
MSLAIKETFQQTRCKISFEAMRVREALNKNGLETPLVENQLDSVSKYEKIKASMTDIMETLGLDLKDDSLMETPHRIAKMYVNEIFCGLDYENFPKITVIDNKMGVEEMVKVKDISLTSTCEHHFVTIDGVAKVAYIPNEKIIGLSKINRIVRFFAQRPQVQERMTQQVLVALQTLLETEHVAVTIEAKHYCVKARGVMDANSSTQTTALGGGFKSDPKTRSEFLM